MESSFTRTRIKLFGWWTISRFRFWNLHYSLLNDIFAWVIVEIDYFRHNKWIKRLFSNKDHFVLVWFFPSVFSLSSHLFSSLLNSLLFLFLLFSSFFTNQVFKYYWESSLCWVHITINIQENSKAFQKKKKKNSN